MERKRKEKKVALLISEVAWKEKKAEYRRFLDSGFLFSANKEILLEWR